MPQKVRVPLRVIVGSYSDATVTVYVKIAALERKSTGCEAGVAYLSGLLGLARSTVERALTQLMRPDAADDIVELTSQRRTLPGGDGETAVRRIRATDSRREHGAWVPSRASESLSPRQLRCYAALSYATATGVPITLAELARVLRHRSGTSAGQPLTQRSVRRILRDLEQLGWVSVDQRAGHRGRHLYTVHDEPLQPVLTADSGEGSGADLGEGSLHEEHHLTDSPDDQPPTAALEIRRRREQVVARAAVENPLPTEFQVPARSLNSEPQGHPNLKSYAGPQLSLAPRIWRVLEPVKSLLPGLSPYMVRALAREIGRQLDEGQEPERLRRRLEFRVASTDMIRDPGRWLLGAAVVRRGCALLACESGRIWHTGRECDACARARAARDHLRRIDLELDERERQLGINNPYQLPAGPPRLAVPPPGSHP
ncbi:hypothetical protein ACIQPQ_34685 [Streptomyces sp. NPDC091281]|uniref:hypothetical protein n=1 Tax=Streptomyces sp. NPDC091281 TaxID=3365985 RepID=UPI003828CF0F